MDLVIGASGQVGEHLMAAIQRSGRAAVGTCRGRSAPGLRRLDATNEPAVHALVRELQPSVIYLPAALTNVDYCEEHPDEAYATNVLGALHVARAASAVGAKLVYFSTDYIFDGRGGPYREDDPANPICAYGRQKLGAEHWIALHAARFVIVRTTVVYGWEGQGKNFVARLLRTLRAGQPLRVPVDQIGSPTYVPNLADVAVALAARAEENAVYNVAGPRRVSRYDFARAAARAFGLDETPIRPVMTDALGQVAARPLRAGLLVEKVLRRMEMPLLDFEEGLRLMASSEASDAAGAGRD